MPSLNDILNVHNDSNYDDWTLLAQLLSFILMCFVIGLNKTEFRKNIKSLFKYKGKNEEYSYASLGITGNVFMLLQMSLAVGASQYVFFGKNVIENPDTLWVVIVYSLIAFIVLFIKVSLFHFVNNILYRKRLMITPPSLWTSFYSLSVFTFGSFLSIISVLFFLFRFPFQMGKLILIIFALIVEISIIIKSYRVFFRKKIGLPIFFLYLCALEFAPTLVVWLLIG